MKKLTLSMEEKDIRDAHRLARRHGTSVSRMFSRIVRAMARRETSSKAELPPVTRKMLGMVKLPAGKTERDLLEEALVAKYGLSK